MINWTKSKTELDIIGKIAKRASKMAEENGFKYDTTTAMMDIDACHSNGCPLRLLDLLNADNFNFAHDVFGINKNINRVTGKMEGGFSPRYSAR